MLTIPIAFFIVMLELSVGSFLVLYLLDLRNDTSVNFIRFQSVLYLLLFTLLTWASLQGFTRVDQLRHDFNLDYSWLQHQSPALFWFMILQIPYALLVLISAQARIARYVVGGVTAFVGLYALFAVGMGYRVVEAARLGGAFTVLSFVTGGLALGGVSTAMLLGHWYLNTPTASGKPLEFATGLTIIGIVAQIALGLLAGPSTYTPLARPSLVPVPASSASIQHIAPLGASGHELNSTVTVAAAATPTPVVSQKPAIPNANDFGNTVLTLLAYLLGLGLPLGMSIVALYLERERSFQSATGMLYIAVVFVFFGEILARNLFLQPLTHF